MRIVLLGCLMHRVRTVRGVAHKNQRVRKKLTVICVAYKYLMT